MTIAFLANTSGSLYIFRMPIMMRLLGGGHKVYAICPDGPKCQAMRDLGLEVVTYKMHRRSLNPFSELSSIASIYRAIKPLGLDILHTFTVKPNIYGTIAGRLARVPTILNLIEGMGSFYTSDTPKNRLVRLIIESLYRVVFRLSQACVFVNSDDPKYFVRKHIIAPDKVTIIKSVGIDTKLFGMANFPKKRLDEIRAANGFANELIVLMVARAIWDKGVREFYAASDMIADDKVRFVFVGDIDEGNPTCASREFLQSARVTWLGHRDDVLELSAISDIYVLPSYREGVPRTLLEAASLAKPIVTTDTVGCREVVDDGVNGFLVPIKDAAALAEKIKVLADEPALRAKMGKASRAKAVGEFEVTKVVEQYIALYTKYTKDTK
jgi:N,N'-diacetylbacillosaminyl-diphospho-undecaprenol alpha-1,3-N-acetylgalactosaminyltransferase